MDGRPAEFPRNIFVIVETVLRPAGRCRRGTAASSRQPERWSAPHSGQARALRGTSSPQTGQTSGVIGTFARRIGSHWVKMSSASSCRPTSKSRPAWPIRRASANSPNVSPVHRRLCSNKTDTFFPGARGRLKLRQLSPTHGELISYHRADLAGTKQSLLPAFPHQPNRPALRAVLADAYGIGHNRHENAPSLPRRSNTHSLGRSRRPRLVPGTRSRAGRRPNRPMRVTAPPARSWPRWKCGTRILLTGAYADMLAKG